MDSTQILQVFFTLLVTYAMHSTVFLGLAWFADRPRFMENHGLRGRLWKLAALAPMLSTVLQLSWSETAPVWEWQVDSAPARTDTWADSTTRTIGMRAIQRQAAASRHQEFVRLDDMRETLQPDSPADITGLEHHDSMLVRESDEADSGRIVSIVDVAGGALSTDAKRAPRRPSGSWSIEITPRKPANEESDRGADFRSRNDQSKAGENVAAARAGSGRFDEVAGKAARRNGRASAASGESRHTMNGHAPGRTATSEVGLPDGEMTAVAVTTSGAAAPTQGVTVTTRTTGRNLSVPVRLAVGCGIAWILIGLLVTGVSVVHVRFLVKAAAPADSQLVRLLDGICQQRNVRRQIQILISPAISEPCACGVFRWTILLPPGIGRRLSDSEMRALLRHEIGHLVRRDTAWALVGRVFSTCLAWQPLNLLAVRRWQQAAEFECDDWAAGDEPSRLRLAHVLTTIADIKSRRVPAMGVPATAPPLSQRVERLLKPADLPDRSQSRRRRAGLLAVMLAGLGIVPIFAPRLVWADSAAAVSPAARLAAPYRSRTQGSAEENPIREIRSDLQLLANDLELALDLLNRQEQDEAVQRKADLILQRLKLLRERADKTTNVQLENLAN